MESPIFPQYFHLQFQRCFEGDSTGARERQWIPPRFLHRCARAPLILGHFRILAQFHRGFQRKIAPCDKTHFELWLGLIKSSCGRGGPKIPVDSPAFPPQVALSPVDFGALPDFNTIPPGICCKSGVVGITYISTVFSPTIPAGISAENRSVR